MAVQQQLPPNFTLELFTTYIRSNRQVNDRHKQAFKLLAPYQHVLQVHDVAMSADAKRRWQGKAQGNSELPCLLVNGVRIGDIADLQLAVDDGKLRQFLRLDNPPSRPSFDDDLESLSEDQVDELLAAYETESSTPVKTAIVPLETPPATPKIGSEVMTPAPVMKAPAPVSPLTPPATPQPQMSEAIYNGRAGLALQNAQQQSAPSSPAFTAFPTRSRTPSSAAVPLASVQEKTPLVGLGGPLIMRAQASRESFVPPVTAPLRKISQSSINSLSQLPPLPASASSSMSFSSSALAHRQRSISSLRNASSPPPVPVHKGMHKRQQSSLADLCATIDDFLTPEASPAPSPVATFGMQQQTPIMQQSPHFNQHQHSPRPSRNASLSPLVTSSPPSHQLSNGPMMNGLSNGVGEVPMRDFLHDSPNMSGPTRERAPTPELKDLSGYARGMRERKPSPPRHVDHPAGRSISPPSQAMRSPPQPKKKGGLFSCCGSGAADNMDD